MTAIDVEVQVGTTPDLEADVQIAPPTFTVVSVLPTGPRGPQGATGATGATGPQGPAGADGADGADGEGVPIGGTAGQVLTKDSGTDFDTSWQDSAAGSGIVETVVAGSNVDVDATDPANPIVSMEALLDADIPATIARDSEVTAAIAASEAGQVRDGDTAGGVLSGTYPNPGFAADMATQAELDAHINDTADAHDASAISIADAGNDFTATDVEGALAELQADHEADATALSDHIADASGAHAASAVAFTPAGTIAATDVQAAIEEVAAEAAGGGGQVDSVVAGTNIDVDATDPANPVVSLETLVDADIPASIARDAEVAAAYATIDEPIAAAHIADASDAHDASAISIADAGNDFTATDVEGALAELQADHEADATALSDHIADTADAHDASAISFSPTGTIGATDVQAAIAEVASEAGGGVTIDNLAPTHDTYLNSAAATTTHDASTVMWAGGPWDDTSSVRYPMLRFDLSTLPSEVASAKLRLRVNGFVAGNPLNVNSLRLEARKILRTPVFSQATWNQYSTGNNWTTAGAQNDGADCSAETFHGCESHAFVLTGAFITIDLTKLINDSLGAAETSVVVILGFNLDTLASNAVIFDSVDAATAAHRPVLQVVS